MGEKLLLVLPVVIGILLATLGIAIRRLKLYFLISGYNLATPYQKSHVDVEGLAVLVERGLLGIGLLTMLLGIAEYLVRMNTAFCATLAVVYTALVLVSAVAICIRSQRYVL